MTTAKDTFNPRRSGLAGLQTMNRITLVALTLTLASGIVGCADLSPSSQRMMTGTMIGAGSGAAIGAIAGSAGMGAGVGAAAGLLGGYLYDQHEQSKQQAYQQGYTQGRQQATKPNPPWQ